RHRVAADADIGARPRRARRRDFRHQHGSGRGAAVDPGSGAESHARSGHRDLSIAGRIARHWPRPHRRGAGHRLSVRRRSGAGSGPDYGSRAGGAARPVAELVRPATLRAHPGGAAIALSHSSDRGQLCGIQSTFPTSKNNEGSHMTYAGVSKLSVLSCLVAASALAQNTPPPKQTGAAPAARRAIEEVVVTARKRNETSMTAPVSVTALG